MFKIIKAVCLIFILAVSAGSAPPLYYVSPGLQVMYDFNSISFGLKLSLGVAFNTNICNLTGGILGGRRSEYYFEFQDIPYGFTIGNTGTVLTGVGVGISKIKIGNSFHKIQPRISLFAGEFLFINATYTFLDSNSNLSKFQIGSTLVCPIPLNLDLGRDTWN
jgi:hypothetical protein